VTVAVEVLWPAYWLQFCWTYWGNTLDAPSFSRLKRFALREEWYEMALNSLKKTYSHNNGNESMPM